MSQDLHVLFIPSWYPSAEMPTSGIFFKDQALALHRAGVRVGVIFQERQSLRKLGPKALGASHGQVTVECDEGLPTFRRHGWNLMPRLQLGNELWVRGELDLYRRYIARHGKPDIIHAHSAIWGGVAAARIASLEHMPFIITEHNSAFAKGLLTAPQQKIAGDAFRAASRVICVGSELQKLLVSKGFADEERIEVIPNMVATEFFTLPKGDRHQEGTFRYASVAFLRAGKGLDVLLSAFAEAFRGDKSVILEIGGDGPIRPELEHQAASLGILEQVQFSGALSRDGVRDLFWRSNALVHPSLYETFGVVLIEALSTGIPVVATRCGGPQDIVNDACGTLVEPGSVEALAEGMRSLRRGIGEFNGDDVRDQILSRFSSEVVASRIRRTYEESLACNVGG